MGIIYNSAKTPNHSGFWVSSFVGFRLIPNNALATFSGVSGMRSIVLSNWTTNCTFTAPFRSLFHLLIFHRMSPFAFTLNLELAQQAETYRATYSLLF